MKTRAGDPIDAHLDRGGMPHVANLARRREVRTMRGTPQALGALALGAVALGALAIGAVAVGRLVIGRARIRRLEIDELVVRQLRVTDELQVPPKPDSES